MGPRLPQRCTDLGRQPLGWIPDSLQSMRGERVPSLHRQQSATRLQHGRLSALHHAARLVSGYFVIHFPRVDDSAIRDAIQLCLRVFRRNRPAYRLNPYLYGHFIPAIIPGNSPFSPRRYLSGKPGHWLYPHENNHRTTNAFFPFLYNGFRGSSFTRKCRFAATLLQASHIYSCARGSSKPCRLRCLGSLTTE